MTPSGERPDDTRLLLAYLRPERRNIGALALVLVVAMTLPLAGPVLVGRFVDDAIAGEPTSSLLALAGAFLVLTLAGDLLQLVVTWLSVRMAWRVGNTLRRDLCEHALSLDLDWHSDHSPGQLIERVDGDVDAVTRFSSTAVLQLLGNAFLVVGAIAISAFIEWRAAIVIGVTVAAAVATMIHFRRSAIPLWDDEREIQSHLYGDIEERLGGLEDLRANRAGAWAEHRLHQHSSRWWHAARRAALRGDGALTGAGAVFAAGTVATLAVGAWQARSGAVSVGAVLALVRFSQLVSDPIWKVSEQLAEAQKAVAGTRRAARLLATRSPLADPAEPCEVPAGALSVELRNVTFGYGTRHPVLTEVDLRLGAGRHLGIVGRTGSGKTTIGRLVGRLWDTEQGAVLVGGIDVRDLPQRDLRRRIGIVTQDVELFRASVRDNLTLFGSVDADDATVWSALEQIGLGPWLTTLPDGLDQHIDGDADLSAGESQLLAFARLLLADPSLVILDEASSRLDPATEAQLDRATELLLADRTAIIIAHRLATLDRVDEICVLDHGRVAEHGERAVLAGDPTSRFHDLLAAGRAIEEVR